MADLTQHWKASYETKYLGAWDLWIPSKGRYAEVRARIVGVTSDEVIGEGGRRSTPRQLQLVSVRTGRPMPPYIVSNKSGTTLQIMFGPTLKDWLGDGHHEITFYVEHHKRVRKGTGDVLVIRNERASEKMREELQARAALQEDDFTPEDPNASAH